MGVAFFQNWWSRKIDWTSETSTWNARDLSLEALFWGPTWAGFTENDPAKNYYSSFKVDRRWNRRDSVWDMKTSSYDRKLFRSWLPRPPSVNVYVCSAFYRIHLLQDMKCCCLTLTRRYNAVSGHWKRWSPRKIRKIIFKRTGGTMLSTLSHTIRRRPTKDPSKCKLWSNIARGIHSTPAKHRSSLCSHN